MSQPPDDLEAKVAAWLRTLGFDSTSIAHQPVLAPETRSRFRPDFAIVDPQHGEWLTAIEVKERDDPKTLFKAGEQLRTLITTSTDGFTDGYVVTATESAGGLALYHIAEDGEPTPLGIDDFPPLHAMRAAAAARRKATARVGIRTTTDRFRSMSWILAAAAFLVVCGDLYLEHMLEIHFLDPERITLLILAVGLALLPSAAKLKAFGIEFERIKVEQPDRNAV